MRAALLAGVIAGAALAGGAAAQAPSPLDLAAAVVGVRHVPDAVGGRAFDLAPDGRRFVYLAAEPTADGGAYALSLRLGSTADAAADRLLVQLSDGPSPNAGAQPRFSPDGTLIAYIARGEAGPELRLIGAAGAAPRVLADAKALGGAPLSFAWSPDGRRLAVVTAPPPEPEPTGGIETPVTWPYGASGPGSRVTLVDAATGAVRPLTGASLDVSSLSWSPDGRRLALAAAPVESPDRYYDQDLWLADTQTGALAAAVRQPGVDSDPAWSPDGRRIAFATQAGQGSKDWLQSLGLYDVVRGTVAYPAAASFREGLGTPRNLAWASGDRLLFTAMHRLRAPLFELSVGRDRLAAPGAAELSYVSGVTVSRDGRQVLFGRETVSEPAELHLTPAGSWAPRPVTRLNPGLELPPLRVEEVEWTSADGRWPVHGLLLTDPGRKGPAPLITVIEGGPQMVTPQFGLGVQHPVHALVRAGYAVFAPNTRGRSGYSHAFRRAIRDEKDYVGGGFADLMSGIDRLVARGVADPDRLGIAGFSYGSGLAGWTIGHTRRFGAASLNDTVSDLRSSATLFAANPAYREMWDHMLGFSDPYDADSARRMQAQSSLDRVADIRTPVLLEAGMRAYGGMDEPGTLALFQGLRRHGVTAEFIRYPRTGHGLVEPRLRLDSARRNLEWFDRWLGTDRPGL